MASYPESSGAGDGAEITDSAPAAPQHSQQPQPLHAEQSEQNEQNEQNGHNEERKHYEHEEQSGHYEYHGPQHHHQPESTDPSQQHHLHHQQQQPLSPADVYDDSLTLHSPLAATAVAHHGLQVLQAASAGPPLTPAATDLAQQYAQSAAMQMGDAQFSAALANPSPPAPLVAASPTSQSQTQTQPKVTRLRRACDLCSQRKVKCDDSGPPCKPCRDLDMKSAARAAKHARTDNPSAAPHNAAEALISIAANNESTTSDAEAIAPWPILQLLVDDFFTYIHPLMPFPHEPSFRHAFTNRMDRTSGEFLALLASMIGVLVASFPRSARAHLKSQQSTGLFLTAFSMIDHCRSIALEARGVRFMMKQEMSVDDAATSYFLGIAAAYTLQWKPCKRFMAETMTFCRELGTHRQRDTSTLEGNVPELVADLNNAANKPVHHIKDQIGKRIFWVMVAGVRSMTHLGASINELPLSPPTTQEPYPDQPLEVDDGCIFSDQIHPQPEGVISLITGFNRNIRIYMTMNELIGVDMCYGMNFFDWIAQKNILSNGLASAKQAADDMPAELQVKIEPGQTGATGLDHSGLQYYPPGFSSTQAPDDMRRAFAEQPMRRRELQCEIQKANIYASQLATRSYFVERYLNLRDAHRSHPNFVEGADEDPNDDRDAMIAKERELIVQTLLTVLASISQRNMEPNGQSIISKIRLVASTLLNDAPERKGPLAIKAEQDLSHFLDILMTLEKNGAGPVTGTVTPQDEEEELQSWANLREYQLQFLSNGGYLAEV
ncbi:Uu.00g144060.m01.CDS01 [Anthostomella pinea]|uniref:Uu.00g144060.m01.CDS01 n=1 Tax=Anthostomella pinea TaxID=933095 RepID=A0AAI8YLV2_9PEZI|nr:Uu.00g144060.m01.CDS01 [Anthostomella pinea]